MVSKLGERLLERLAVAGVSQADLARQIGVTQPAINHMIKRGTGGSAHLHKIARVLKTTPEYLIGDSDDPSLSAVSEPRLAYRHEGRARDDDMVDIAQIDLGFGLGAAIMDEEIGDGQVEMRSFPRAWLRQITTSPPAMLYWAKGVGNSAEPTIGDGDIILIDRSQSMLTFSDLMWAFAYGQTGMVKRLRPMPDGSLKLLSDNPNVPPEIAYDGEVTIFGRVIAVVKRI